MFFPILLLPLPPAHNIFYFAFKKNKSLLPLYLAFFLLSSFLFNDTNLFCGSFSHSKALWLAHSTMAGMRSHKTNACTWSQPGHLRDPYLLPFTCLFYPGLFVTTLWRVFLIKSHEDGSKNNSVLLVNTWLDLDGRIVVFLSCACCGVVIRGGEDCYSIGPSSPE